MTRRRRAGRKRTPGPRTASGRLVRERDDDRGTEQIQSQRAWLAQRIDDEGKITMADPVKCSYPLGVLLANGTIDGPQHDAGTRYAKLYAKAAGRVSPKSAVLDDDRAGRAPEDDEQRERRRMSDEAALRDAATELGRAGRHVKDHVDNVAVYNRTPRWMLPVRPRAGDIRDADALIEGLECLARVFGYRRERRAA